MVESATLLVDSVLPLKPIRQWVLSVPFALRWLFAAKPEVLEKALGIVIRAISSYLIKKAGLTQKTAKTGAVTLIQRFGSALNLNIHFHVLFLDGVYAVDSESEACHFHEIETPTPKEIGTVLHRISGRVARLLARTGFLERDTEQNYLTLNDSEDDVINSLQGSSITYRIAVGRQRGKKVFTLQTLPAIDELDGTRERFLLAKEGGFSLHADVAAKSYDRAKVERLCRYISRPSVSTQRLKLVAGGRISYELKNPYSNGTTHVIFEPLDFIARLAALVPKPRMHLTRFHGVFAPNSKYRALVTGEVKRGDKKVQSTPAIEDPPEIARRAKMTWAQRLKRVFNIDVTICRHCQGPVKIIACIEDPQVITRILAHLNQKEAPKAPVVASSGIRAPPTADRPNSQMNQKK